MRFCAMALVSIGCSNIGLLLPLTGAVMNFSRTEFRLWALDHFCKHSFSWHVQQTQIWPLLPHLVLHQCYCLLRSLILKWALNSKWAQSQHADHHTHTERFPADFWKEICLNEGETRQWHKGINLQNYFFAVVEDNFFFVNAIKS